MLHNMLAMLNTSKSCGPDDTSEMMLKSTATSIAPSLAKLFNTSLAWEILPTEWKLARVVPVPKSDELKNPVSGYIILPTVNIQNPGAPCKQYHSWPHLWILSYIRLSVGIHAPPFPLPPPWSLSSMTGFLPLRMDKMFVYCFFFDIQKAFDSGPHFPQLQKFRANWH